MKAPSKADVMRTAGTIAAVTAGVVVAGLLLGWLTSGNAGQTAATLAGKAQSGLSGM